MNRIDLKGKKFGRLVVLEYAYTENKNAYWKCKCACGNAVTIRSNSLRTGNTKSCGCLHKESVSKIGKSNYKDITGSVFGGLLVIAFAYTGNYRQSYWVCKCLYCGNELIVRGSSLKGGDTKSCGCKGNMRAENHYKWNVNRDEVTYYRKIYNIMIDYLRRLNYNKNGRHTEEILGYTKKQLKNHIELQFLEGMSWQNHGEWHIDHIKPVFAFVKEGTTDPKIINALENLQPLWAKDNLRKGASYR